MDSTGQASHRNPLGSRNNPRGLGFAVAMLLGFAAGLSIVFAANISFQQDYVGQGLVSILPPLFQQGYGQVTEVPPLFSVTARGTVSVTLLTTTFNPMVSAIGLNNNNIYLGTVANGSVSWTLIPGASSSKASLARCGQIVYVAVRGLNDGIYVGYVNQSSMTFSGWVRIPGATPNSPSIALDDACQNVWLAVRGYNNRIYVTIVYPNLTWSGSWQALPGATDAAPAVTVFNGTLYVAVKGFNSTSIWLWNGTSWTKLPGATDVPPSIASNSTHILIAVKGLTNQIFYSFLVNGTFNGWTPLPGATSISPTVAHVSGEWYIIVKGANNPSIYFSKLPVTTWQKLPGATNTSLGLG
ncbi:MAG: hypothetical protein LRS43_00110 [Desulfurococcales archaeon]|nr:hypothetical protein [Desulfurococcales archaeon]